MAYNSAVWAEGRQEGVDFLGKTAPKHRSGLRGVTGKDYLPQPGG